jgi:hypothetical protein
MTRYPNTREVTVKTTSGGIGLGKIDDQGRLVYLSGYWVPLTDADERDRYFRRYVAEIIEDGGKQYKLELLRFIPMSWLDEDLTP